MEIYANEPLINIQLILEKIYSVTSAEPNSMYTSVKFLAWVGNSSFYANESHDLNWKTLKFPTVLFRSISVCSLNISSTNFEEYMPGSKSANYHNFKVTWQGQIRSNRKIHAWLLAPLYRDVFCKISTKTKNTYKYILMLIYANELVWPNTWGQRSNKNK